MVIVILCENSPAPTLVTAWICVRTVGEGGERVRGKKRKRGREREEKERGREKEEKERGRERK